MRIACDTFAHCAKLALAEIETETRFDTSVKGHEEWTRMFQRRLAKAIRRERPDLYDLDRVTRVRGGNARV